MPIMGVRLKRIWLFPKRLRDHALENGSGPAMGRDGFLEICNSTAPIGCNHDKEGPSDFTPEHPLMFLGGIVHFHPAQ